MTFAKMRLEMDALRKQTEKWRRADIYLDRSQWSERLVRQHERYCERNAGCNFETYLANQEHCPDYPLKPEYSHLAESDEIADHAALYYLMLERTRCT